MNTKLLVIDDEHGLLEVVEAYLKKEKYDVLTSDNGREGYELFLKEKPDM